MKRLTTKKSSRNSLKLRQPFKKQQLILAVFSLVFGVIGCYLLFRSFAATSPSLKPRVTGLMVFTTNLPAEPTYIDTKIIHINWADLSPTKSNQESRDDFSAPGWNEIDRQLSGRVKAVRLRIFAGVKAPDWVRKTYPSGKGAVNAASIGKPEDGRSYKPAIDCSAKGGIAYRNDFDGVGGCIPYFWYQGYIDKYEELMRKVARRYENNSKVREIVDSACMTQYAEPFYRRGTGNFERLRSAGLTFALDRQCHEKAILIHKNVFPTTRTSLAINPWDNVDNGAHDWESAKSFGDWAKAQLGVRLTFQNNGFGVQEGCPTYTGSNGVGQTHCYIAQSGHTHGWQIRTYRRIAQDVYPNLEKEDLTNEQACPYFKQGIIKTLENAKRSGASFVELPTLPTNANCSYAQINTFRLSGFSTLAQYDNFFQGTTSPKPTDPSPDPDPIPTDEPDKSPDPTPDASPNPVPDNPDIPTTPTPDGDTPADNDNDGISDDTDVTPDAPGTTKPDDKVDVEVDGRKIGSRDDGTVPSIDTSTLSNGEHTVRVKVTKPDGSIEVKEQTILVDNDSNLYEKTRNAILKPIAGKPAKTLDKVFAGLIAIPTLALGGWFALVHMRPRFSMPGMGGLRLPWQ